MSVAPPPLFAKRIWYHRSMVALSTLTRLLAGRVAQDPDILERYSRDASLFSLTPQAVVFPNSVADIQTAVRYAGSHAGISLTVRSGGSDMTGGPLTESVVLDVSKHLNNLVRFQGHHATVQPGMFYRDFEKQMLTKNLLLPSYPASKNLCTVGGMVANNSGGEKTLAYGKTERYVEALRVVLADGNEYEFAPLDMTALSQKTKLRSFEGQLYRQLARLIGKNRKLVARARPQVSKNSSGYNLWDIYHDGLFDITKLFVGSQGTLGIITEITFRLITPKPHSRLLVIFLRDIEHLADIIQRVLRYSPESFESYDDHTLKLAMKFLPALARQMKSTALISLMLQFLPEVRLILSGGLPKLVLLAQFTGYEEAEIIQRTQAAQAAIRDLAAATRVTKSAQEAEKYWTIRRESFNLLRQKVKNLKTAPFIDDLIVRPEFLPEFLPRLNTILNQYDITYTIAGHVGDGNFHIIPLMDLTDAKQRAIIPELAQKVYSLVFQYKGSMSAEHNDGLIRSHFLPQMFGPEVYKLFEEVKDIFDPKNIFNPSKKVGGDWKYAMEHLIRS